MTEKRFDVSLLKDNIKDLFKTYLVHSSTLTEQSIVKTIWREVLQQIEDSYRDNVESEKRCNLSVEEYRNYTNTDGVTEERFYTEGKYVMQDGGVYVICNGEHNADVVATALNELLTENEQLKKENHGLKLRMSKVYYYFMDYLSDEMNSDSFSEMWDFVVESDVFGDFE